MSSNASAFWGNNPSILLKKNDITELWPTANMDYEKKLNAITRLVIVLTLLGFIFTFSLKILAVGIITLFIIYIYYKVKYDALEGFNIMNQPKVTTANQAQMAILGNTYRSPTKIINPETLEETLKINYKMNSSKNPFSNVLLPEIKFDKNRKPAPPSFNTQVHEDITNATKKLVQELNPGIIDTNKQLFGDLAEKFELDQSNRIFYSTANTRVVNDQGAFSEYLYGTMPSCKDNDTLECVKDNYRYTLY
jgi:hypothetical protein